MKPSEQRGLEQPTLGPRHCPGSQHQAGIPAMLQERSRAPATPGASTPRALIVGHPQG